MKIQSSTLKKTFYWAIGASLFILVVGSVFPISVSVSESQLNSLISKRMPMTIKKEIAVPLIKKTVPVTAIIESSHIKLSNNVGETKTTGSLLYKDKSIKFTAYVNASSGGLYYDNKKYAFFVKPKHINIELNKEDMKMLFKPIEAEVKGVAEKASVATTKEVKEKGFWGKVKHRYKKTKNKLLEQEEKEKRLASLEITSEKVSLELNKGLLSKIGKLKSKAKESADKIIEEDLASYLDMKLKKVVEYSVLKGLETFPVYKFKDKDIDNTAKLFLRGVSISNGELVIEFSMLNILNVLINWVVFMVVFAGIIFLLINFNLIEIVGVITLGVITLGVAS